MKIIGTAYCFVADSSVLCLGSRVVCNRLTVQKPTATHSAKTDCLPGGEMPNGSSATTIPLSLLYYLIPHVACISMLDLFRNKTAPFLLSGASSATSSLSHLLSIYYSCGPKLSNTVLPPRCRSVLAHPSSHIHKQDMIFFLRKRVAAKRFCCPPDRCSTTVFTHKFSNVSRMSLLK
jgi:hypothetical protein